MPLLSESSGAAAASAREWRDAQVCEYGNQLIKRFPGPNGRFPDELYDLAEDPDEEHSRHGDPACAANVAELAARLDEHFARHEDLPPQRTPRSRTAHPQQPGTLAGGLTVEHSIYSEAYI